MQELAAGNGSDNSSIPSQPGATAVLAMCKAVADLLDLNVLVFQRLLSVCPHCLPPPLQCDGITVHTRVCIRMRTGLDGLPVPGGAGCIAIWGPKDCHPLLCVLHRALLITSLTPRCTRWSSTSSLACKMTQSTLPIATGCASGSSCHSGRSQPPACSLPSWVRHPPTSAHAGELSFWVRFK